MPYDNDNIFARILRGELPCNKVYEDEHVLAFHDINPLAPLHILVIPKGAYANTDSFAHDAPPAQQAALMRAIGVIAREQGLADNGYRVIINQGDHGGQEVPHLHAHILGGEKLAAMLVPR
ncbi:MAG: histidine triad nucleotide-binding protein [Alphaproteobacteria bacterium GM202ARS2]|nr:histidine triad nucleotide-binding protein [Alphaproteobacteria bacterium GM202ARS2]